MGVLGVAARTPVLAALGFTGALLHVWNHAILKGLMFLGAGAVAHTTGTRQIDRMGGLGRRMPTLAGLIVFGATAIAGLPPLNAFYGEFLIFLAAFRDDALLPTFWAIPAIAVIIALGVIGGLAAVAFSKLVGVAILGEPRTPEAAAAHRPPALLVAPIAVLAALALAMSLLAPWLIAGLLPVSSHLAGFDLESHPDLIREVQTPVRSILMAGIILAALLAVLVVARRRLLAGRAVGSSVTWDCGYAMPTARMQYTGSSLVEPMVSLSAEALLVRRVDATPEGLFPADTRVATEVPDACREGFYEPLFRGAAATIRRLRWIQQGTTHVYILYIALTLILLLIWCLGQAGR
jgi:NADH:ubiquinone oxidoreductase subunit 5 (subunit L)/multisubunit Na+/H+ antiporter MnhA subunit